MALAFYLISRRGRVKPRRVDAPHRIILYQRLHFASHNPSPTELRVILPFIFSKALIRSRIWPSSCPTMSGATKRRARSQIESGDDSDAARYGDLDSSSPVASDGSKRMRLRGGRGDTSHLELDEDDDQQSADGFHSFAANDDDDDDDTGLLANGNTAINGISATDFSPGAIVRVTIENFVTYERADFFPGPSLNMVIGPNGVGKSSLVCAICLGLGYPPAVLGRAGTVGEFVKHGKDHAIVEIELQKRPQDRANYVIRLRINAENNERSFSMNGKACTLKNIKSVMAKLRIQIDNLCQFLPQDKVAEFAGLEPIEKLNKTLLAAAPEEVVQQQQELKQMFSEQKELQRSIDTGAESLRSLQVRQQGLQADVERLKERDQIQKVVDDLSDARLIVHYNEERARYMQVKDDKKKAEQKHRRLERENQPALENVNAKQSYKHEVERVLKARLGRAQRLEAETDRSLHAVEKIREDMQSLENKKVLERESMDKKKKEVGQYRTRITQLEGQMESGKDIETRFNAREWSLKIVRAIPTPSHSLRSSSANMYIERVRSPCSRSRGQEPGAREQSARDQTAWQLKVK